MEEKKTNLVSGKLYLIPTPLGDGAPLEVLPISVKWAIENIDHYIAESEKTARRFIKRISASKSQPDLDFRALNKFTPLEEVATYLEPCISGIDVGLLSEAGCPGIADPGAEVVRLAHSKKIKVIPLVGPSSILMAMMSSGFNGQNFTFNGYLPIDAQEKRVALRKLEKISKDTGQAQIFIETPYRNDKLFTDLVKLLKPTTLLCVATDITLPTEAIVSKSIHEWKETGLNIHKRPSIFIIQA
ncbi:MAG: SAM-dependent methyltransferase [Bacteroidota bacterium]